VADGKMSDSTITARVLEVTEDVAAAISHIVNIERDQFSAFEQARSYKRLREALERSGESSSYRAMAQYVNSDHGHASIAVYVPVAEKVTDEVIVAAGLLADQGKPDYARLGELSLAALKRVAAAPSEMRADVLRDECGPREGKRVVQPEGDHSDLSFEDRVARVAERGHQGRRWRDRAADIPIDDARRILSVDLLPAAVAVGRRVASATRGAAGLLEVHESASIIVVPAEPESMAPETTVELLTAVNELRRRLSRASRKRRS
jgi:hypothetical protein